jgi:amino acid transporter
MRMMTKPVLGTRSAGVYAILLVLIAAGTALAAVALLVLSVTRDAAEVTVHLTDAVRLDLDERLDLPGGAVLLGNLVPVGLHVPDLPLGLRLLVGLGAALFLLSVSAGALALAQVLRTVRVGRPFARHNATALVVVAVAVLVGGGVTPVVSDAAALAALDRLGLAGDESPFRTLSSFSLAPVLVAVLLLGIAEAFRRGAAMADDVAGLV